MMALPASLGFARPGAASVTTYLDNLPTQPTYAISLKKIVSTATVAIRVRRSSDNAEQDIGFIGDALDTSALASFVGSGSGYVVTAYDQTGNGHNWTQATASKQPRIVNAGTYGGIMSFDGSDDSMAASSVPLNQAQMALFLDGTLEPASSTAIYMEASANWNSNAYSWVLAWDSSSWQAGMNSATAGSNQKVVQYTGLGAGVRRVYAFLFDRTLTGTNQIRAFRNGSSSTGSVVTGYTTNQTGTFGTHSHYIGGRAASSLYTTLTVFSLVCYNGDISSIRSNIEAILA